MSKNVEITVTKQKQLVVKLRVRSISYPYFLKIFKFIVVNLRLFRKLSDVLILGVTNTILVLGFMKSNKFYHVQTAKVVNSKDVSC